MKQTIVMKISMNGPNSRSKVVKIIRRLQRLIMMKAPMDVPKYRKKALKIAVSVPGVEKAEVKGDEKNQISITGNEIDSTKLTKLIRKKVGHAELISVTPVKDEEKKSTTEVATMVWTSGVPTPYCYYEVPHYNNNNGCTIM